MTVAEYAEPIGVAPRRKIDWLPYLVGGLTVFVLVAFLLYPIVKMVLFSFVKSGDALELSNFTLMNFEKFFRGANYQSALWNSIVVALLTTIASAVLALPAAYVLARVTIPFRTFVLALCVIPIIAPPFIGAYAWVILLGRNGIITHYLNAWFGIEFPSIYGLFGIVLALALHYFPYILLLVHGALAAADPYIEESAVIMGARRWRIMRTITFPLVLPTIGAGCLIVLVKALGNFGVPAILGSDYYVLPTLMYWTIHGSFNLNAASAIAMANVLITLIAILVLVHINRRQRFVTVSSTTRRSKQHTGLGAQLAANAYIWILLLVSLLPQITIIFTSFAEKWGATLFPEAYGFSNYAFVWNDLSTPIVNSLFLSAGATVMCVVFGTLAAYTAMRKRFYGKWALDMTIMLPFILPGIVTGVAYLTTFNSGLVVLTGTSFILIFAYFIRRVAYMFRAVSASVGQVDLKIEEASTICGATWGRTMRKVTVPLIAPGILAGGILVFSTLITEISVTIMIFSAQWKTISIAMYEYLIDDEQMIASAIGAIAIIMTLILVFAASKLIGKSMADMFR